jgi:hypothetical protein
MLGPDKKAKKGVITAIGKDNRSFVTPTVKWNNVVEPVTNPISVLKRDTRPATAVAAPKADPKGHGPMDIYSANKGKTVPTCNICGGKGHFMKVCPLHATSGYEAAVKEVAEEIELGGCLNCCRSAVLGDMLTDCMHKFKIMSIANMNEFFVDFKASPLPTPPEEKISYVPKPILGKALIDSGATSCFISPCIVEDFCLRPKKHITPKKLHVIDSQEVDSGLVTEFIAFSLKIRDGGKPSTAM